MLSLQELSDRFEIQALSVRYANAIDAADFDALDQVFTADARIDGSAMGSIAGTYAEFKAFIRDALPRFGGYLHLVGNFDIVLDGDRATGRVACLNPMEVILEGGRRQVMLLGMWYLDTYVRTPTGWRIAERGRAKSFDHNVPAGLAVGGAGGR
jgi:hypothetical protein